MIEYLGWTATAVFAASYVFKRVETLRRVQMVGAALWAVYGSLIGAVPVVVANALVFGAAAWSMTYDRGLEPARREAPRERKGGG